MRRPRKGSVPLASVLALGLASFLAAGCNVLTAPDRQFVSQEKVLESAAEAAAYVPDRERYRLVRLDASADAITFQYLGVREPGDGAWVVRFAQKSTEQDPEGLTRIGSLVAAIARGKPGFEKVEEGRRQHKGLQVDIVRYRYRSAVLDAKGKPVAASGIAAIVKVDMRPAPVIYQFNLENFAGDRSEVGWTDLVPLLDAVPR
jgi:hypothetical protein